MNEIKHYWMKQFTNPSHFLIFIYSIICLSSIPACSGLIYLNDGTVIEDGSLFDMINTISLAQLGNFSGIQFFYSSSCGSCKDAHRFLQSYERKHPEVHIEYQNLVYNRENQELFNEYKNYFHNSKISYPVLFIGNIGVSGSSDIIHHMDEIVNAYQNRL